MTAETFWQKLVDKNPRLAKCAAVRMTAVEFKRVVRFAFECGSDSARANPDVFGGVFDEIFRRTRRD